MKLKEKIMLLVLSGMLIISAAVVWISMSWAQNFAIFSMAESDREKLKIMGNALQQVGTREDFEKMGETAQDAWLKYQFRRCYEDGYMLLKGEDCLENLTDYNLVDIHAMKQDYLVQELGGKHLLLVRQKLEYPAEFGVLAVRDISHVWTAMNQQFCKMAVVVFLTILAVLLAIVCVVRRLFTGLQKLEGAAEAVGKGQYGQTISVRGKDEISQVASAFNQMSLQVQKQVEDLQYDPGSIDS